LEELGSIYSHTLSSIFGINVSYITGFLLSGDGTWRESCPRLWSNPYLGHTGNGPFLCIVFDCMQAWSLDNYICHKRLAARHEWLRKALRFGIRSIGFEASNKCNLRETRLHFDRFLLGPKRGLVRFVKALLGQILKIFALWIHSLLNMYQYLTTPRRYFKTI
jgi:hypothetical protein